MNAQIVNNLKNAEKLYLIYMKVYLHILLQRT